MIRVALVGYGKMGKVLESLAQSKGIEVKMIIDPTCSATTSAHGVSIQKEINAQNLRDVDVCIDFSHPSAVISNINKIAKLKKNMVIGTTGWPDKVGEVTKIVTENGVGLIHSGNFSVGVSAYIEIVKFAANIFDKLSEYDVFVNETHHNQKADSPSGTANMIATAITSNIKRKTSVVTNKLDRKIEAHELHVSSTRGGFIPGIHTTVFDSSADTIELTHSARNREGFALGALMAAKFVSQKKGMFTLKDIMSELLSK